MNMTHLLFKITALFLVISGLFGCSVAHDHENNYNTPKRTVEGTVLGTAAGFAIGLASKGSLPTATVAGGVTGSTLGYFSDSQSGFLFRLNQAGIHVMEYGATVIMVLPSDAFFEANAEKLKPKRYPILLEIAAFIKHHSRGYVTIAAYSDDVRGHDRSKALTQKQAESIAGYMWAHGINHHRLLAKGIGKKPDVASNRTVLGSAMNRHVEIRFQYM